MRPHRIRVQSDFSTKKKSNYKMLKTILEKNKT